ncbi:SpvB/TcaC N-terminal domain-containing protein [Arthrobacter sp. OAP107]|uniref:SpvB/TcaC N-terminal domain-containing protein n=1 Tax=Arthrobacter sp. OAP107 TaxID=3156445 RepID=UPI0033974976
MTLSETENVPNNGEWKSAIPSISLPKGGGAIRGMGEKFAANPVTGTGSMSLPIATSPGRSGFGPQLSISYDSGSGNGPFGFGWSLSLPAITRKTDKGLPQYHDAEESDVFIISGAEDLVPVLAQNAPGSEWDREILPTRIVDGIEYQVRRYRPRIEGLFARIERWTNTIDVTDVFWRSISKDNITTWYGKTPESRISDPANPRHIFSWLICQSHDDKGNAIVYGYKSEDSARIFEDSVGDPISKAHECNRTTTSRSAGRYLKRIRYGNGAPYFPVLKDDAPWPEPQEAAAPDASSSWFFEVVLDYGEHDVNTPISSETGEWPARNDPFSSYRPGFEIRTYRTCQRILMFHHFPGEAGVERDCLVRSTDFTYSDELDPTAVRDPVYSFLCTVAQTGYRRENVGYSTRSLPPVEFAYTEPIVQNKVEEVDPSSLDNLPVGLDGSSYRWMDLHGEGIPGILTEQAGAWFYKRNISTVPDKMLQGRESVKAKFAPLETVALKPNVSLNSGVDFVDLAGDGQPDVVVMEGPSPGFYKHDAAEGWHSFRSFTSRLNFDTRDPNVKFVDLDGDGHADVLITEDDAFVWHASLAEAGFGSAQRVPQALEDENGPRVTFSDGTQSIYLADLSGDGLTDIVRIRNGEVCYWPNLGYGCFGAKVTMDNAPWFDNPDQFEPRRVRLADIDGSGTTDIIYLHRDGVRLYFNQSGNSWTKAQPLVAFPHVDDLASIVPIDLLGNGTACLVWSSPLAGNAGRQMRFVNLMGGKKPHLLVKTVNNMGAETRVEYSPSTKFYLQDKQAGKPWITRLPFPVHVVEKVTTFDHISRSHVVTHYAYHHGYYDGEEREFRGFGMVEQFDAGTFGDYAVEVQDMNGAQELVPELNQPPVAIRTWFHTGSFLDQSKILHQHRHEYYLHEQHVPESVLPSGLSVNAMQECVRALKGLPLHQEVYSYDNTAREGHPYLITENNYEVRCLQPQESQRYGVFFPVGRESISLNYERNPADPRILHTFGLDLDEYGNARQSCSVIYGRRSADLSLPAEVTRDQQHQYVTCSETDYTSDFETEVPVEAYRLRMPIESRSYEITGVASATTFYQFDEIKAKIAAAESIDYEVVADNVAPQKRLLSQSRTLFRDNALNPLPFGQWDSLGLSYQSYQLAFTQNVIAAQYGGKVVDADFAAAGYVQFAGDTNWWLPSGTAIYPADPRANFYIAIGAKDPFGLETVAAFDQQVLLIEKVEVRQAAWNVVTATNDYRVLGPVLVTDPNGNRSAVEHDELGMVIKTAVMGKAGATDGDTLDDPTMRLEYELSDWMNNRRPAYVHVFAREQHGAANTRWQESYAYFNGCGGVVMVKAQTHRGKAFQVNPDGSMAEVDADPRWVGNGRTVLNNKGKPVKQYEPYFSTTHEYEDEKLLREIGVSPVLYYDPLGRNVRTLFPNGTVAGREFTPWLQKISDANDTVKTSQWYADRDSPDPATQPEPLNDPERRAAWLTAKHADTPGVLHFDSLGVPVYAVSDYGGGKTAAVRSESDLTGRFWKTFDQEQREVASGFVGMAGTPIVGESAEKGRRWTFPNVLGAVVRSWDEHGRQFRTDYDDLQRPISIFVQEAGRAEILLNFVVYGDRMGQANAQPLNLLGAAHLVFDQAGMVRVPELDFKGNPRSVERVLANEYKNDLNWSLLPGQPDIPAIQAAASQDLEVAEVFTASSTYDALNRPMRVALPDGTIVVPTYNEANFLASLKAQIRGQGNFIDFLKGQDYDAKGQRQMAHYGNDVFTRYFYDPKTFRLTELLTYKAGANPQTQSLQNLNYAYDPVGNITEIRDDAQQTYFFNNAVVKPKNLYEYDAIYQLVRASGRELAGLGNDTIRTDSDLDVVPQLPHLNSTNALRRYTQEYEYDLLGNIKVLRHRYRPQAGAGSGWTRHYRYAFDDAIGNRTNRLTATSMPGDLDGGPYSGTCDHDSYGNMIRMPHLAVMDWNCMDQLRHVNLRGGGNAYYVYGLGGQRQRKVIERNGNLKLEWIFLGAVMIFRRRRRTSGALRFERWTVHISDNTGQIAQADTKTFDDDNADPANPLHIALIRYQYTNRLGSAVLETDENGNPISYEEYHPYGTSAYRSAKPGFDLSLKRYRFSGKEQDQETGLYYFGQRYYAPWLGRWISSDPRGFSDGLHLFRFARNSPAVFVDATGTDSEPLEMVKRTKEKLTGEESFDDLKRIFGNAPAGWQFDPSLTNENYRSRWLPDKGGWYVYVPTESNPAATDGSPADENASSADSQISGPAPKNIHPTPPNDDTTTTPPSEDTDAPRPDSLTHAGPVVEKGIWLGRSFRDRGFTLEHLYNNDIAKAIRAQGDNRPLYDVETDTRVKQIKSSNGSAATLEAHASKATRDAGKAIASNATGSMAGKSPQAVVITPTDAPPSAGADIATGYNKIRGPVPDSIPPEHVRGLPGALGVAGRGLTVAGYALSAFALGSDLADKDYAMAGGDAVSTVGGGLEVYALASPGATAGAGVTAMTAGLALGGVGIAITSAISGIRAFRRRDFWGAFAGGVGLLAGAAITIGAFFSMPAFLVGGLIAAAGVGLFHLQRWLRS